MPQPSLARLTGLIFVLFLISFSGLLRAQAPVLPDGYELHPLGGGLEFSSGHGVAAVHVEDNDVFYGGDFTQAYNALENNLPTEAVAGTRNIARWDGERWHALGGGANSTVYAIATAVDGSLYAAGSFTSVTQSNNYELAANRIARFKDGQWSTLGAGLNSTVHALAIVESQSGHALYAGGWFTGAANYIARWDGSQWLPVGQGLDGAVSSIQYSKTRNGLYVGGSFNTALAQGEQPAVTLNGIGFWSFETQQWYAVGQGFSINDSYRSVLIQESSDGSIYTHDTSNDGRLYKITENLGLVEHLNVYITWADFFVLPSQQILRRDGADRSAAIVDLSQGVAQSTILFDMSIYSSSIHVSSKMAIHPTGMYLGFARFTPDSAGIRGAQRLVIPDIDGDEIANDGDNCPLVANVDQADLDQDYMGDACDPDIDGDGFNNGTDAFPTDPTEWADTDGDTIGDNADNCLLIANINQANLDQDGFGDACDSDIDDDGFLNEQDDFPNDPTEWLDTDGDGIGDNSDPDADGDGIVNADDNCPTAHNPDQLDLDGNGVGEICEGEQVTKLSCVLKTHANIVSAEGMSLSPDANTLYVGTVYGGQVTQINTRTNQLLPSFTVNSGAWDVLVSADGQWLYSTSYGGSTVNAINLQDVSQSLVIAGFGRPHNLAFDKDQRYLFVSNDSSVSVVDRANHAVVHTIPVGATGIATGMVVGSQAGSERLYVANFNDRSVSVIDISSETTTTWAKIESISVGTSPYGLSLDRSGYLYVSNFGSGSVTVVDTTNNSIVATVPTVQNAFSSQLSKNGRYLYVTSANSGDSVFVIDTALARSNPAKAVLHKWSNLGTLISDVLLLPSEKRAYVSARESSTVQYLAINQLDSNNNGIGDDCEDTDADGLEGDSDNCPLVANPDQLDADDDGQGDVCDLTPNGDDDGDGIDNLTDNCRLIANTDQADFDQDGVGDICDLDSDGDSVPNAADEYPLDDSKWRDGEVAERLGDAAKQNFGQVIVNLGDINNDYADDYAIGTPNFKASIQVNGKTKLLNKAGKVEVISGKTGEVLLRQTGSAAKALLGSAIVAADVDRDGLIDIAIGSPGANKNSGEVVICLATVAGSFDCDNTITPDTSLKASLFGSSLATAEINGASQLFIGAPNAKNDSNKKVGAFIRIANDAFNEQELRYGTAINGGFGSAMVWLPENQLLAVSAPRANKTGEVTLWDVLNDQLDSTLTGQTKGEQFGKVLTVGSLAVDSQDINTEHLIVSAPLAANGKLKQAGRVDVFDLGINNQPIQSYLGMTKAEQLGTSLAVDDQQNLFVGSAAYTVPKTANSKAIKKAGKVSRFILANENAQAEKVGTHANQKFGASLAAIELTGDFNMDLLVGSIGANDPGNKKLKAVGKTELINANDWPQ